jgi:hypothetical protein
MASFQPKFKETITVGYWDIRGISQQIRLLLSYVGADFQEKFYPVPDQKDLWFEKDKK